MRLDLLVLLSLAVLAAGCTSSDPKITRDSVDFVLASSLAGVNASESGDLRIVGANGIRVEPDAANGSVRLGLGPLAQVQGGIIACGRGCDTSSATSGMIVADGSLISHNDLALNAHGPDRDSAIYFFDKERLNGQYLRWADGASRFQLSDDVEVLGEVLARGPVGTVSAAATTAGQFVYTAALEGNEQGVYLRGSGTLEGGTATILFPETFSAVVGNGTITAQVTLTSPAPALYVDKKARDHLVVSTVEPFTGFATFDWFVQAPRAGGEEFRTAR